MKIIKLAEVPLDRVDYGDLSDVDVKNLPQGDPIQEPIFRLIEKGKPLQLVMGRRLVALALKHEQRAIMAKIVECEEHEIERLRIIDAAIEARHRKDKDAWYGAIVKLVELYIPEAQYMPWTKESFDAVIGRPTTPVGRARLLVGEALGIGVQTIYKAERYIKKGVSEDRKVPDFEHFGLLEPNHPALKTFAAMEERSHLASVKTKEALKELTKLERDAGELYPPGVMQRIRDGLEVAGMLIRKHSPRSLCPWCKGAPGVQEKCESCYRRGWVGNVDAPDELKNPKVIMVDGELRSLAQVLAEHEASKSLEVQS